ncbi:MAG TPA: hypothetical protein VF309_00515, partial [Usitatibacter sp.]
GDLQVLAYSKVWKWLVRAFWIFPVVIALVGVFSPPVPGERWIPFAIIGGFTALCWPLTLEVFRRRIELGESGISQQSAWSRPVTIAWKDVRDVAFKLSGDIELVSTRGKKVRVSVYLSGMETFAETLERRLAHLPSTAAVVKKIRATRV